MTTAKAADTMFGEKLYQRRARTALPIMIRQAKAYQTITYQNLADEMGMPNPRNLNYVLGSIGETLLELSRKWNEKIPLIGSLVVNKYSHIPGIGIAWFINSDEEYSRLSRKEKERVTDRLLADVYDYQKWDLVLSELGLQPAPRQNLDDLLHIIITRRYGAGESQVHKDFKNYISRNPQILKLPRSVGVGDTEVCFPSGDTADVFFVDGDDWIIVEVKSRVSDIADIYRGLYQCKKYQAVGEAMQLEQNRPQSCRVLLVLENRFPERLLSLKNTFAIEVIDNLSQTMNSISLSGR